MADLGSATGYLELDISRFRSALQEAQQAAESTSSTTADKWESAGKKLTSVGSTMTKTVTLPIVGLGTAAVKTAGDFESGMSQVQATMGITKDATSDLHGESVNTMDALGNLAKEMGSTTAFSAKEAADGINILAMAGKDTTEIYDMLPHVLNLASAGGLDLATSADYATGIMAGFGIETSQTQSVVDKLAKMSSSAKGDVNQFGQAMATSAGQASATGQSFDDVATSLMILGNHNVSASEAGNALNRTLKNLYQPSTTGAKALDALGVSAYDAEGNARRLPDVLNDINKATDGMTTEEKNNILGQVFDAATMKTIPFLLGDCAAAFDTTDDSVTSLYEGLQQASSDFDGAGAAAGMAETQLDNLEGKITIFKSALEGLAISFGNLILPAVTKLVEGLTKLMTWLTNLPEPVQRIILIIAAVVAAIGPLLIVIGKIATGVSAVMKLGPTIVSMVTKIGTGLKALWGVMMANPIVLIIAAIAALVAGFIYLWNTNEDFRQFWINLWETIKNAVVTAVEAIGTFLESAWNAIKTTAETVWNAIKTFFTTLWEGIKTIFETVVNAISTFLTNAWTTITTGVTTAWNAISTFFSTIWNAIKTTFETVINAIKSFLTGAWNAIKSTTTSVFNSIKSTLTSIWNGIKSTITSVVDGIKNGIQNGFNAAKNAVTNTVNGIKNTVTNVFNGIKSHISGVVSWLKGVFNFSWSLPKIKLPHFSISGSFSLNPPSIPHFSVEWYKKAMKDGMILNDPTIFGMKNGSLLGGGEAGPEAIVGVQSLREMIQEAIYSQTNSLIEALTANAGNASGGTIVVQIGDEKVDAMISRSISRQNFRSGGR